VVDAGGSAGCGRVFLRLRSTSHATSNSKGAGCIGPSSGKERPPQDDKAWLSHLPSLRGTRFLISWAYPGLTSGAVVCRPLRLRSGQALRGWGGVVRAAFFPHATSPLLYCTPESIRATRSQNPARPVPETPLGAGGAGCWHGVLRRAKNARLRMTDLLEVAISFLLARRRTFAATSILRAL
jgi:hypothetical protein